MGRQAGKGKREGLGKKAIPSGDADAVEIPARKNGKILTKPPGYSGYSKATEAKSKGSIDGKSQKGVGP